MITGTQGKHSDIYNFETGNIIHQDTYEHPVKLVSINPDATM